MFPFKDYNNVCNWGPQKPRGTSDIFVNFELRAEIVRKSVYLYGGKWIYRFLHYIMAFIGDKKKHTQQTSGRIFSPRSPSSHRPI